MKNTLKPKVGIIVGSNRPTRICHVISDWIMREIDDDKLDLSLIDLAEINLPFLDEPNIPARHDYTKDHTKAWSKIINDYDGFVIVYPQYNWGYPAVLKNAMDFLYDEWANKPVSLMCYGNHGGFQGFLAMKLVIQGLDMVSMSTNPPINIKDTMFNEAGQLTDVDTSMAPYKQAMKAVSAEFIDLLG